MPSELNRTQCLICYPTCMPILNQFMVSSPYWNISDSGRLRRLTTGRYSRCYPPRNSSLCTHCAINFVETSWSTTETPPATSFELLERILLISGVLCGLCARIPGYLFGNNISSRAPFLPSTHTCIWNLKHTSPLPSRLYSPLRIPVLWTTPKLEASLDYGIPSAETSQRLDTNYNFQDLFTSNSLTGRSPTSTPRVYYPFGRRREEVISIWDQTSLHLLEISPDRGRRDKHMASVLNISTASVETRGCFLYGSTSQSKHNIMALRTGHGGRSQGKLDDETLSGISVNSLLACQTCRRRRLKCDLREPECERCLKAHIKCAGYTKDLKFVDEKKRAQKRVQIKRQEYLQSIQADAEKVQNKRTGTLVRRRSSQGSPSPAPPEINMAVFLQHIQVTHMDENFFAGGKAIAPWNMEWYTGRDDCTTTQTIRALGSMYYGRMHKHQESLAQSMVYYGKALRLLAVDISSPTSIYKATSVTNVVSLCIFEVSKFSSHAKKDGQYVYNHCR